MEPVMRAVNPRFLGADPIRLLGQHGLQGGEEERVVHRPAFGSDPQRLCDTLVGAGDRAVNPVAQLRGAARQLFGAPLQLARPFLDQAVYGFGGLLQACAGLIGGRGDPSRQFLARRIQRRLGGLALLGEEVGELASLVFIAAGDLVGAVVQQGGKALRRGLDALRCVFGSALHIVGQALMRADQQRAHLFGVVEHGIALGAQLPDQAAHAHLIVGECAFQCRDLVGDAPLQRGDLVGRQHGGRRGKIGLPLLGRIPEAQSHLREGAAHQPQILHATDHDAEAEDHEGWQHPAGDERGGGVQGVLAGQALAAEQPERRNAGKAQPGDAAEAAQ